jgi:hypothetical protein
MPRDVVHPVHPEPRQAMRAGRGAITCLVCPESPAGIPAPAMITKDFPLI